MSGSASAPVRKEAKVAAPDANITPTSSVPAGPLDMEFIKLHSANGSWGPDALSLIGFTTESLV